MWMQGLVVVVAVRVGVGVEGRSAFHVSFFPPCRLSGESFCAQSPRSAKVKMRRGHLKGGEPPDKRRRFYSPGWHRPLVGFLPLSLLSSGLFPNQAALGQSHSGRHANTTRVEWWRARDLRLSGDGTRSPGSHCDVRPETCPPGRRRGGEGCGILAGQICGVSC